MITALMKQRLVAVLPLSSACSLFQWSAWFGTTVAEEGRLGIAPSLQHRLHDILGQHSEMAKQLCADQADFSPKQWQKLNQAYGSLTPVATCFQSLLKLHHELTEAEQLCNEGDADLKQLAEDEVKALKQQIEQQRKELLVLLLPKDEDDRRGIILEVRAGTGGDEAALFASDLLHMYEQYALQSTWRVEVLEVVKTDAGGYKYASLGISGSNVFGHLKFENGVHRVQRVPETEAHGRIHTSTATVAILPEPDEIDVNIKEDELRIDTYRSGGAGGQHVNTTDSAVRVTHLPSGIVVTCQDERSQHKNKAKALKILRARLYEVEKQRRDQAAAQERRQAVGTGDRNERIRTYNFPQGRVTDHRVNLTEHGLEAILSGERLDVFIDALQQQHQTQMMAALSG